jgi:hypothetical protein
VSNHSKETCLCGIVRDDCDYHKSAAILQDKCSHANKTIYNFDGIADSLAVCKGCGKEFYYISLP